ncbi:unnamed protein product [Brassica rapa subsp. narinosa]
MMLSDVSELVKASCDATVPRSSQTRQSNQCLFRR